MADFDPVTNAPAAPTVSPFELLSVLWRRKLIVITVVIASVAIAVALSLRSPKQYAASAQLLFREPGFAQALFGQPLLHWPGGTAADDPDQHRRGDLARGGHGGREPAEDQGTGQLADRIGLRQPELRRGHRDDQGDTLQSTRSGGRGQRVRRRLHNVSPPDRQELVAQAEELVNQSIKTASPAEQLKLSESLRQLGVLRSLQTGDAEVIARAEPDPTPVSPKPKRDAILGFVVGLLPRQRTGASGRLPRPPAEDDR